MTAVNEAIAFYEQNYKLLGNWLIEPGKKILLGSESGDRVCRFCDKQAPEVTFKLDAHAIPQSLGNKSLFSTYECDDCNELFGNGIENDFGNWSKPMRTFARIRGYNGVPTLKKAGPSGWRVEYGQSGFTISHYEENPLFTVDEDAKNVTFRLHRDVYTPVAVLKAFVKMGLSVMPDAEMSNFGTALKWIRNPDHQVALMSESEFPILYSFVPGPMPNNKIAVFVFRRKDAAANIPYAFFILGYGNDVFQVFLPTPERDQEINGKKLTIMAFPNPRDIYPSEFGSAKRGRLNLGGRNPVKGEILPLTMGFGEVAEAPSPPIE